MVLCPPTWSFSTYSCSRFSLHMLTGPHGGRRSPAKLVPVHAGPAVFSEFELRYLRAGGHWISLLAAKISQNYQGYSDMQIINGSVVRVTTLRKWMRHLQVLTGAALMTALVAAPTDSFSQQTNASRFKALPRSGPINGKKPLSLRSQERVKVVVTMSTLPWRKCAQRPRIIRSAKPIMMQFKRKLCTAARNARAEHRLARRQSARPLSRCD